MAEKKKKTPRAYAIEHYVAPLEEVGPTQAYDIDQQQSQPLLTQRQIFWWKFRRHRLAYISGLFLLFLYGIIPFVEIIAPYNQETRHNDLLHAPPQSIHLFHDGQLIGPFVYAYKKLSQEKPIDISQISNFFEKDLTYEEDRSQPLPLRFFCKGDSYLLWGLIPMNFHLVCPPKGGSFFLLGSDRLGRDVLSRILYGARISLTIGLIGISISFVLGMFFGGLAGYYGGWIDNLIQRMIEILRSFPQLPLWMTLSAILPAQWSPAWVYFGITLILGLLDWPGLARSVRSKLLSLREEDFATAAQLTGASPTRIIRKHLLPNFSSHLIASVTLTIPSMILGETALSYLGLGLRPPITSWGVMLNEAQNMQAIELYPWLLLPAVPVILVVLAFNFLGDGLRDAADPHT